MLPKSSLLALLLLVSTYASSAQESSCRPAKIGFYVEFALGAKDGVTRLYKAEEFAASFHCGAGQSSASDLERCKADYERRRKQIVDPIISDLKSRMAEIAQSEGFSLFEGVALDESKSLIALDPRLNLTSQFVLHFNEASFKPGLRHSFEVPLLMVGVIDSRKLYGSEKGLTGFESVTDLSAHCGSGPCNQLFDRLQNFTREKKYGAIFDSSRELSPEIRKIACYDATDEFIKFFNRQANRTNNSP